MKEITHKQAQSYLRLDLDGLLGDTQRLDLEAHLAGCEACRAEAGAFSTLTSRLRSEFHGRWDAHDGPSQHVTANVRSQTRRIIMSNKVNLGLRALGGVAVLVALGFVVNFVISQLRGHSVAANNTPDNNMPVNSLEINSQLIAFASTAEDGNAEIYTMHTDGSNQVNITRDPANDTSPVWSSDGKRLAFLSDRSGSPQIYSMNPDGTELIQLTNISDTHYWVYTNWSPDGKYLVAQRIPIESKSGGRHINLYLINADGSGAIQLTENESRADHSPKWSPGGEQIAFIRSESKSNRILSQIYTIRTDGTGLLNLSNPERDDAAFTWSADGAWITHFSSPNKCPFPGDCPASEIQSVRADGTERATLLVLPNSLTLDVARTDWSPDGMRVVMVSWDSPVGSAGNSYLSILSPFSNSDIVSRKIPGHIAQAYWSPDGQFFIYGSDVSGNWDIYTLDANEVLQNPEAEPIQRTNSPREDTSPAWQPMPVENLLADEGIRIEPSFQAGRRRLAFTMERNGQLDIYTVRADGSDLTNLTGDSNGSNPYWSPDGRRIAFNRNIGSTSQVFLMDADGSNVVQLTDDGDFNKLVAFEEGRHPDFSAWSPDGSKLVFMKLNYERANDEGWMKLYVLDVATKTQTPLTSDWGLYQSPAWSPGGGNVAFLSVVNAQLDQPIFRVHVGANGTGIVNVMASLPDDEILTRYHWSNDGQSIFFSTYSFPRETYAAYKADLNGNVTELARTENIWMLDWWDGTILKQEPHSKELIWLRSDGTQSILSICPTENQTREFSSKRSHHENLFFGVQCSFGEWHLYLASEDGTTVQELVNPPLSTGDGSMVDQAWSPDDNFIAFNISSQSGSVEMFILDVAATLDDPTLEPVWFNVGEIFSSTDSISWQPVITEETLAERPSRPYEGLVAFTSAVENGNLDIYTMRPDGSGLTNLTNDPAHDVDPYWSPDGKRIAFLSDRAGYMQIFVMNADGSDVFQVTRREADHAFQGLASSTFDPWSPDGSKLAFLERTPDGGQLIYTVDANGRNGLPLVYPPGNYTSISWSPDGSHLAYVVLSEDTEPQIHITDTTGNNTVIITDALPAGEVLYSWKYSWTQNGRAISFVAHRHIDEGQDQWVAYEAGINGDRLVENATSSTPMHSWRDGTAFIQGFDLSMLTWLRSDGTFSELDPLENCQPASNAKYGFLAQRSPNGSLLVSIDCPNYDLWFHWSNPDGTQIRQLPASPLNAPDGGLNGIFWSPADRYAALNVSASGITYLYVLDVENGSILTSVPIGGGDLFYNISWQPMP